MITGLYAGLLAFGLIYLSFNIVRRRRELRLALGDEDFELKRRIRAQANFIEYSVFFLLLLSITEHNGLPALYLHAIGLIFLIARTLHAHSLLRAEQYVAGQITAYPRWRFFGMIGTFGCIATLALITIAQYLLTL